MDQPPSRGNGLNEAAGISDMSYVPGGVRSLLIPLRANQKPDDDPRAPGWLHHLNRNHNHITDLLCGVAAHNQAEQLH